MHTQNQQLRTSVLVVDDPHTARLVRRAVDGIDVLQVDSYLHALGYIPSHDVVAILSSVQGIKPDMSATISAIKKLAPKARLILVAEANMEADAMRAVRLGAYEYLVNPVSEEMLAKALSGIEIREPVEVDAGDELNEVLSAEEAEEETATVNASEPASDESVHAQDEEAEEQAVTEEDQPVRGAAGVKPKAESAPESIPQAGDLSYTSGAALGDIDLVEHLLRRKPDLYKLALSIIRQQTQDTTLRWGNKADESSVGKSAAVQYASQTMGYLISDKADESVLEAYAAWLSRWLTLENQIQDLNEQAFTDSLTGVRNRRYFERRFNSILNQARNDRFQVTLMIYDIDNFKQFNDQFGHMLGDKILTDAAQLMQSMARKDDVVARIGGDEFAVIFWDAEPPRQTGEHSWHPNSFASIAKRYREAICQKTYPSLSGAPDTITISGGLASYPWDGQTAEELIAVADKMLLRSKSEGKNVLTLGPGARRLCGLDREE